ncbi:Methyltransferase OMS1, mitochondrial [Candida viswanathii]|uniref:Methyltransferase OMS1, mitochondrial n=1 Tax=Candida viswanathii TaxID=5486 RepID=A0A367Y3C7_9ASCO|nr:Methyltransferase OMS1, mitochondrial [Candida viswanathii]
MPKIYIGCFIIAAVPFYFYMRDSLSEYEYLVLKSLNRSEKLRPLELKKYKLYQLMRKDQEMFNPSPQELNEWYHKQYRFNSAEQNAPVLTDVIDSKDKVNVGAAIQAAEDTTAFYEEKAKEYDDAVKWEERGILMGGKRSWLMQHAEGDVLEVSCGTGRNIPYFYPDQVKSITFIDSARNMPRLSWEERGYDKIAENVKYDTVIEAFGLCNMAKLLKPGGRIVLLEHGRMKENEDWKCRWNLDIGELIDEAGLDITVEKRAHFSTTWMLVVKHKLFGRDPKKVQT